jgi:predicted nucleic acid-binding protein
LIIADSSIWIDFQRDPGSEAGRELDQLLDADEVVMVGPVLTEVLQGARSEDELEFFSSHLTALLFLETSQESWVRAGELNYRLKQSGNMLSVGDLMISTLALQHDMPVYSLNGDFDRVPGLQRHMPEETLQ